RDCLNRFLRGTDSGIADGGDSSDQQAAAGGLAAANVPAANSAGRVQTREDAFRALLQVADFFRRTEPHSPVSYALEQAVRWGRMSLPELWRELIEDHSARSDLFRRTGIRESSEDES